MNDLATCNLGNPAVKDTSGKRAAFTMEFLYDTSLITAAVFVFALILNCSV